MLNDLSATLNCVHLLLKLVVELLNNIGNYKQLQMKFLNR